RRNEGASRRDCNQARNNTRRGAQRSGLAQLEFLYNDPAQCGCCRTDQGVEEDQTGVVDIATVYTGVETEPAEPQDGRADQDQRKVVASRKLLAKTGALAKYKCQGQCSGASGLVNYRTTGPVERA